MCHLLKKQSYHHVAPEYSHRTSQVCRYKYGQLRLLWLFDTLNHFAPVACSTNRFCERMQLLDVNHRHWCRSHFLVPIPRVAILAHRVYCLLWRGQNYSAFAPRRYNICGFKRIQWVSVEGLNGLDNWWAVLAAQDTSFTKSRRKNWIQTFSKSETSTVCGNGKVPNRLSPYFRLRLPCFE